MTGRHSEKSEKAEHYETVQKAGHYESPERAEHYENTASGLDTKKIILIIILTAVVTAALTAGAFVLINSLSGNSAGNGSGAAAQSSVSDGETAAAQSAVTTTEQGYTSAESSDSAEIVVPTVSGEEQGESFGATFTPYLVKDTGTGQELTLKEVFGSSYSDGGLTFNEDGTFVDSITASSVNSGAYVVQGDTITTTDTNDKNMQFSVLEWNGTTPAEIKVTLGEIDIYFK